MPAVEMSIAVFLGLATPPKLLAPTLLALTPLRPLTAQLGVITAVLGASSGPAFPQHRAGGSRRARGKVVSSSKRVGAQENWIHLMEKLERKAKVARISRGTGSAKDFMCQGLSCRKRAQGWYCIDEKNWERTTNWHPFCYECAERRFKITNKNSLDVETVVQMQKLWATGDFTQQEIADQFGVTQKTVSKLVTRANTRSDAERKKAQAMKMLAELDD